MSYTLNSLGIEYLRDVLTEEHVEYTKAPAKLTPTVLEQWIASVEWRANVQNGFAEIVIHKELSASGHQQKIKVSKMYLKEIQNDRTN
jgi:hypothetical protein